MMRLLFSTAILCFLTGSAAADSKSGDVKFTGPRKESVKVSVGDKLKVDVVLEQIDVGNQTAVSVGGTIKNTSGTKMNYSYHVAFLDKSKNLIGCQNFNLFVDGGKEGRVGTFINLPPEEIAKIAYYTIVFYESEKPIGSR